MPQDEVSLEYSSRNNAVWGFVALRGSVFGDWGPRYPGERMMCAAGRLDTVASSPCLPLLLLLLSGVWAISGALKISLYKQPRDNPRRCVR